MGILKKFGKWAGKEIKQVTKIASIALSPNPIQAASAALSGGSVQEKKNEVQEQAQTQSTEKAMNKSGGAPKGDTKTGGTFMDKTITVFGFVLKLWIVILVAVGLIVAVWMFMKKKTTRSAGRRRTAPARAARARRRTVRRK
jgi:disulfide bond formation protein DsbB